MDDQFLRVRITYTDAKGEDKLFVMSDFPVRADATYGNAIPCRFDENGNFRHEKS